MTSQLILSYTPLDKGTPIGSRLYKAKLIARPYLLGSSTLPGFEPKMVITLEFMNPMEEGKAGLRVNAPPSAALYYERTVLAHSRFFEWLPVHEFEAAMSQVTFLQFTWGQNHIEQNA